MQTNTTISNSTPKTMDKTDVRQGRRVSGMPTVLAVSTVVIIVAFATMLIANIA